MPDDAELGRLLKDAAEGPEGYLLQAEQNHLLHQAILRIPPTLRIVLVLHDMEELTTEQVAQILDLKQGTVRIRLHRARLAVRKEMSQILSAAVEPAIHNGAKGKRPSRSRSKSGKRPAECRDLFANLSEYLDGRVEPLTCDQMRRHIEACPSCVAFLYSLRSAIDRCRSMEMPCDPALAGRLRAVLTREYLRMLMLP
jgi:RNA polymerase sigma-70 factor (ECF subfamily)